MYVTATSIVPLLLVIFTHMRLGDIGYGPTLGCGPACSPGFICPPCCADTTNVSGFNCLPCADTTDVDEGMDDDSESTQSAAAMESFRRTMDVLSELHVQDTRQHGKTLQDDVDLLAKHWRNFGYYKDNVPPTRSPRMFYYPASLTPSAQTHTPTLSCLHPMQPGFSLPNRYPNPANPTPLPTKPEPRSHSHTLPRA